MTDLSQWFDLAEQKPWEVGVYEVQSKHQPQELGMYSFFDGHVFRYIKRDANSAFNYRADMTFAEIVRWRGLSTNPEVKKKPANKRKTMYVVQALWASGLYKAEGSYQNHENAKNHLARLESNKACDDAWIEKIRFRTPE